MLTPWVLRLIIANVVIYVLTKLRPPFMEFLAFSPLTFLREPWTIVTYMFAHSLGDFTHILFNMLSLFFFGPRLEHELGSKRFLMLYFLSGIAGALLTLIFTPNAWIIGASGATYGVMMGYALFWPRDNIYVWGVMPVQVWLMVIFMTVMSLFGAGGVGGDGIAHYAHLGGFLGGFLYIKSLRRTAKLQQAIAKKIEDVASMSNVEKWKNIPRGKLHEVNRDEYDRIMAKLSVSGVASLSESEKAFLERFSET
jgi:membrane associated rhomboid family serine protease